jgi:uncharacterized YccA/Bax inhibitor family protein
MLTLGIILLVLGALALIAFYNGAPEGWLRVTGIILLLAGLLVILLPLLLDAADESRDATVLLGLL